MLNFSDVLADAVKLARERLHLTQQQAADRVGIYKKTLLNIENRRGNPKLDTIAALIRGLEINPMEIFYPESSQDSGAYSQLRMLISQCSEKEAERMMTVIPGILTLIRDQNSLSVSTSE